MTAPTPEYLRNLADYSEGPDFRADTDEAVTAALRAAADRLEAADTFDVGYRNGYAVGYAHAKGKFDTAPQENRALAERARREGWHDIDGKETHR